MSHTEDVLGVPLVMEPGGSLASSDNRLWWQWGRDQAPRPPPGPSKPRKVGQTSVPLGTQERPSQQLGVLGLLDLFHRMFVYFLSLPSYLGRAWGHKENSTYRLRNGMRFLKNSYVEALISTVIELGRRGFERSFELDEVMRVGPS